MLFRNRSVRTYAVRYSPRHPHRFSVSVIPFAAGQTGAIYLSFFLIIDVTVWINKQGKSPDASKTSALYCDGALDVSVFTSDGGPSNHLAASLHQHEQAPVSVVPAGCIKENGPGYAATNRKRSNPYTTPSQADDRLDGGLPQARHPRVSIRCAREGHFGGMFYVIVR